MKIAIMGAMREEIEPILEHWAIIPVKNMPEIYFIQHTMQGMNLSLRIQKSGKCFRRLPLR
jgi:hypothetical protein